MVNEVGTFIEKDYLIQNLEREFLTTIKILKAFPEDKAELKPSEKSRTARELAWNFVTEQGFVDGIIKGKIEFGNAPTIPSTMKEIISVLEKSFKENIERLKNLPENDFNSPVKWIAGPGKLQDFRKADVLNIILLDMVHHRGQMSVYIRIAGGKLPSIYGPTADEPWM